MSMIVRFYIIHSIKAPAPTQTVIGSTSVMSVDQKNTTQSIIRGLLQIAKAFNQNDDLVWKTSR